MRLQPSPLDVASDTNNQTQVLKLNFKNDKSVIHEVEEENEPATNRHSIMKKEKNSFEENVAADAAEQMYKTSRVDAPANLNDRQKGIAQEMASTGGVTVQPHFDNRTEGVAAEHGGDPTQVEMMDTVQAQVPGALKNDGSKQDIMVSPPETDEQHNEDEEKSVQPHDSRATLSPDESRMHVAQNFSQDKISLGVND